MTFRNDGLIPWGAFVYCVLVNWNGWQDTVECLQSLALQDYAGLRIVVIDNASTNDSVVRIREAHPQVEIIEEHQNLGFSGGCNVGIREALARGAEFIWLLNNDTTVPPDTLARLVAAAEAQPRAGVIGTVLHYLHHPERIQAWGGGEITLLFGYVKHYDHPARFTSNSFLTFASALIRRETLLEIGLMDEGYFMYFDDADFCFRAQKAGWQLAIAADTAVLHKEGGSTNRQRSREMERIITYSGLRFLSRHAPVPALSLPLFILSKIAKRLSRGNLAGIRAVMLGIGDWLNKRYTAFQGKL